MKKIIYIFICIITSYVNAQVYIGTNNVLANESTLLFFEGNTTSDLTNDVTTTNSKGIILPAVATTPTYNVVTPTTNNPNNGTFIFDRTSKMIKMFENGYWKNISNSVGSDLKLYDNSSAELGKGVIIGEQTTNAKGVLVLESTSKSLILPQIQNPHITVKSPYAGMICYDTVSNTFASFDGVSWNYWR